MALFHKILSDKRMRCSGIKENVRRYRIYKKRTQHHVRRFLSFFCTHLVELSFCRGHGKLGSRVLVVVPIAWVRSWRIGALNTILLLGAGIGIMPFQSTLKAGNSTEVNVVGVGCFASKSWIATRTSGVVGAWSRCISRCPLRLMRGSWRWVDMRLLMLNAAIALIHQTTFLTFYSIVVLAFH